MIGVDMAWTPLDSTMLAAFEYDREMGVLRVRFKNGAVYGYRVPAEIAQGLADADSPGQYFNAHIKGRPSL